MNEKSCKYDFHSYASHWLNFNVRHYLLAKKPEISPQKKF